MSGHDDTLANSTNIIPLSPTSIYTGSKRLPNFIAQNIEPIVGEWEIFARTLKPLAAGMTPLALRDHIHQLLAFVVSDMQLSQTSAEQKEKSHGDKIPNQPVTAAQTHAAIRLAGGFDIGQMASEYRALRASVLNLWNKTEPAYDAEDINDMTRFNESIDQELAESVDFYTYKSAQSRDLMIGILGHDLRGPLQAIMLSTELALHIGKLSDRQTMLARQTLESAIRMSKLIDNLLDVTRARSGEKLPVVRTMMNMGFVAQQIVDEVRVVNPHRTIELTVSGILVGEWDKARVGQVFSNLINNAIQYSFQGSSVRIDVKGETEAVILTIGNDGVPIPPEKIAIIFDPLTRVSFDDGIPAPSANLGLGLYITKEVMIAHGGAIDVTSSEMDGTIFTARFPQSKVGPELQPAQKQA